jgi:hypothetical protein
MKLADLKWWHWTLATIAIAAVLRMATGGALPFIGVVGGSSRPSAVAPATPPGPPHRDPNTGKSLIDVFDTPGMAVDRALPELNRLTIEARIPNSGKPADFLDQTGLLTAAIAKALQDGISEDSDAMTQVRILVATKGVDRAGRDEAHLALYAIDFAIQDLFALKPGTAPAAIIGKATHIVFNSADAHDAAKRWCAVPANLGQATLFCGLVGRAKGV